MRRFSRASIVLGIVGGLSATVGAVASAGRHQTASAIFLTTFAAIYVLRTVYMMAKNRQGRGG